MRTNHPIRSTLIATLVAAVLAQAAHASPPGTAGTAGTKPTIVLVHGAFADSSSWDGVIAELLGKGYPVIAASNPLRGVAIDAAEVKDIVNSLDGDVVLVGHSYGGMVITAAGSERVKALVYVDGFAPEAGESAATLGARFPGATLAATLAPPVMLSDGGKDLYIQQAALPAQFAADLPLAKGRLMAVEQRPITQAAFEETLQGAPAWKAAPSYFIYGGLDKNITPAAHDFMAKRAGSRKTVLVPGSSHVVMMSNPKKVADLVVSAATGAE